MKKKTRNYITKYIFCKKKKLQNIASMLTETTILYIKKKWSFGYFKS